MCRCKLGFILIVGDGHCPGRFPSRLRDGNLKIEGMRKFDDAGNESQENWCYECKLDSNGAAVTLFGTGYAAFQWVPL